MMLRLVVMIQLLFLFGLHMQLVHCGAGQKNGTMCLDSERRILLDFKDGFQNKSGRLASWNGTDCCRWQGISCDKLTGHVISLNLSLFNNENQYIYGISEASLKPSLVGLTYLKYIDLSGNNFAYSPFPHFLNSFRELKYLNLFDCNFSGTIPEQFGNLSGLHYLDLSLNDIHDSNGSWLHKLSSLHSIRTLKLSSCGLSSLPRKLSNSTMQFLSVLDLSFNNFNTAFPQWLFKLTRLEHLDLHYSELHEISSDLGFSPPGGEHLNSSFPFLSFLDLSFNNLNTTFPQWLFTLTRLEYLDLSYNDLRLESDLNFFPQEHLNSSFPSLSFLNLAGNDNFNSTIPEWLYKIMSVQHLDLSYCSLQGEISHDIGALSSLEFVSFKGNNLQGLIPAEIGNLSNLLTLDLSETSVDIAIDSKGMGDLCNLRELFLSYMQTQPGMNLKRLGSFWSQCKANSLEILDLSNSGFYGNLPDWLWGLQSLNTLYLGMNSISGSIPAGIGKLSSLQTLKIFNNLLNGSIDKAIGNLSKLETLDLHGNNLKGVLTESRFSQLVFLTHLDVSGNSIVLNVSSKWIPPFLLDYIDMSGCPLGPLFPSWIQGQKTLNSLYMSSTLIGGSLPGWFWSFALNLVVVDLSNNNIHGIIPSPITTMKASLTRDNSSSNSYQGANKKVPPLQIVYLFLSNNSFSGPLPLDIAEAMPNINELDLSMNNFTGSVPFSLCDLANLRYLDLSKNSLSGDIPNCWSKTPLLGVINFGDNYLSGGFPCSLCISNNVFSIQLNDNLLTGKVPRCLKKCANLQLLDIGNNRLTGHIPRWLGESNLDLEILSLRSNSLLGQIPPELSFLNELQILDLSGNNFSGEIPSSLGNLTGMKFNHENHSYYSSLGNFSSGANLALKGFNAYYKFYDIINFASIDLSCNKLSGDIPVELTDLFALAYLNLSNNHLGGEITSKIGNLMKLESLDLSRNQLDGPIPDSLFNLSFLSHLNLSYNLLSGKIPTGPQLQTLTDPSIYEGNLNLCGPPLNNSCEPPIVVSSNPDYIDSNVSEGDFIWNLGSIGFGFAVGLLGFSGFILYQSKWSDAYLRIVDMLLYKIFFKWII